MTKKVPRLKTDEEAEAFLRQDLTDYLDLEGFKRTSFEFLPKTERVNLRFSAPLLAAVRAKAKRAGQWAEDKENVGVLLALARIAAGPSEFDQGS